MKIIFTISLFLALCLSTNGQVIYKDSIAPKVEFLDWINNPDGNSALKDKPIILEFWSTWCGPCIEAIPHFNKLSEKYSNDITFISVNSYETRKTVEQFLSKTPMATFVALDQHKNLKDAFKVQNIPVTIIIDQKGMLRWRGITTELTDDLLNTFLTQNRFEDNYKQGLILDQVIVVKSLENVNYQLRIEYGDATLGKSVSTNSDGEFLLKLGNYSIYSLLGALSELFDMGNDWKFEGNFPDDDVFNLMIKSDVELPKETNAKSLINEVIIELSKSFNFIISENEELQTFWYIIPDTFKLEPYRSINQDLDIKVLEQTEDYTKYQNVFF